MFLYSVNDTFQPITNIQMSLYYKKKKNIITGLVQYSCTDELLLRIVDDLRFVVARFKAFLLSDRLPPVIMIYREGAGGGGGGMVRYI